MKRGDITLELRCGMPERLVTQAVEAGARLASARLTDSGTLVVRCDAKSARTLTGLCERHAIPCREISREGWSRASLRLKRRATLPAGLLLCIALCALFMSRIWIIDIVAPDTECAGAIQEAVGAMGVHPGMGRSLGTGRLADALQAGSEGLSFVSCAVRGVRLLIEAHREAAPPPVYHADAARDLVAACDGVVTSATARAGELCVCPGDVVRRGQTLIRGEERLSQDKTRPIAALGEVVLKVWFTGSARLPDRLTRLSPTGREAISSRLSVAGTLEWPIARAESFARQRVQTERIFLGLFVPVELVRERVIEVAPMDEDAEPEVQQGRAKALALADAATALARCELPILGMSRLWCEVDQSDAPSVVARAIYEVSVSAAVSRDALY